VTGRQRILNAVSHRPVDRVPIGLDGDGVINPVQTNLPADNIVALFDAADSYQGALA
jgi:hypothetical protein